MKPFSTPFLECANIFLSALTTLKVIPIQIFSPEWSLMVVYVIKLFFTSLTL